MPPSATPPLSLREPPGRKSYSDMKLQVELGRREVSGKGSDPRAAIARQLFNLRLDSRVVESSSLQFRPIWLSFILCRNSNGGSVVTSGPCSIHTPRYARFHSDDHRFVWSLRMVVLERTSIRGGRLYDGRAGVSPVSPMDARNIPFRRDHHL
jgi:hypothetical protein